jgi:hypothetical protein
LRRLEIAKKYSPEEQKISEEFEGFPGIPYWTGSVPK